MKSLIRSATAMTLLALAATACAPANPAAPGTGPSVPPSQQPGGQNQQPGDEPQQPGQPSEQPQAGNGKVATLRGKVYDEKGAPVDGGQVQVKSLNPSVTFDSKVNVVQGSYVVNSVPAGVLLDVMAMKDGWTQRSRVATLLGDKNDTELNFGGSGDPYFISDYPEIMAVEPATENAVIDGDKLLYKLTLSEALDDQNRRRLENALRLLPANAQAQGGAGTGTTDIEAAEDAGFPYALAVDGQTSVAPYAIQKGTTFMGDADSRAKVNWSEDGLVATLEFNAPLVANKDADAKYQLALVSDGTSARIVDKSGKQLGTDAAGSLSAYPAKGSLILSTIEAPSLALKTITGLTAGSAEERWAATHLNVGDFKVKQDEAAPQLESISYAKVGSDSRLELVFSEPMAAFNGSAQGYQSAELLNLAHYTFAVGKSATELEGVELDGKTDLTFDPATGAPFGDSAERTKEFRFAGTATQDLAAAANGAVVAQVDPQNPKRVFLYVKGVSDLFETDVAAIKARVEGAADPAGNAIVAAKADEQVKMGDI